MKANFNHVSQLLSVSAIDEACGNRGMGSIPARYLRGFFFNCQAIPGFHQRPGEKLRLVFRFLSIHWRLLFAFVASIFFLGELARNDSRLCGVLLFSMCRGSGRHGSLVSGRRE